MCKRSPISVAVLVLAFTAAAGCDQQPAEREDAGDHVFKGQVQAIDKARDVETMLRQKADAQQQQ